MFDLDAKSSIVRQLTAVPSKEPQDWRPPSFDTSIEEGSDEAGGLDGR